MPPRPMSTRSRARKRSRVRSRTRKKDPIFVDGASGTWATYTTDGGGEYDVTYVIEQVKADIHDVSQVFKITIAVKSTTKLASVLGNKEREVTITTLKRAI